jgi:23S rRNA (adenine2503-C2)-methyltransferase
VPGPYELSRDAFASVLADQPRYRVDQVWDGLHRVGRWPWELTNLPRDLRTRLEQDEALQPALSPVVVSSDPTGETIKWLWRLHDGAAVETVLMHYGGRARAPDGEHTSDATGRQRTTVCVSTQAGCAMACGFCATGQAGFERHLSSGEIVEQVMRAWRESADRGWRLGNVVFMGMGEPLANYDRVWAAVERLHGDVGLSARHLTVSTVGIVPGITRLAAESLPVNLAVSLHAANDRLRDTLVPINRRYPLATLTSACASYVEATGRRLSFEWALIDGVNDRPSDAGELSGIARRLGAHVNLIPLNPTPGYATRGTPAAGVRQFRERLTDLGVNATVRQNRGTSIDAACGQLRAAHEIPVTLSPPTAAALPD